MTDDPHDAELERAVRDGLRQVADRAEVGVPLAERAHGAARGRRRRRWTVVGTVAAVVAVSGVAVAVRSDGDDPARRPADHAVAQPTSAPVAEWRAESWHGLTVDVPADWGWGTAPMRFAEDGDRGQAYFCGGPGAEVAVGGGRPAASGKDLPWVGRPIMLSDACGAQLYPEPPPAPYVWLGADVDAGTVDLGGGYTQETVEAFGTTLTVASPDPAFREHVIDSARATTGCATSLDGPPAPLGMPVEGLEPVHSARVCAYRRLYDDQPFELVYATTLDEPTAQELYSRGTGRGTASCGANPYEYVTVTFSGKDRMGTAELTADWVVDPGCRAVSLGGGAWAPLTQRGMALWSANGVRVTLTAFIGILG
jgi:hypothetical protein